MRYDDHISRPSRRKTLLLCQKVAISIHFFFISKFLGIGFDTQNILIKYFLNFITLSHISESFANMYREELTHLRNIQLDTASKKKKASHHGPRSLHSGPYTNFLNVKCFKTFWAKQHIDKYLLNQKTNEFIFSNLFTCFPHEAEFC